MPLVECHLIFFIYFFSLLSHELFVFWEQVVVSLGSGPWDQLFGGGNSPAFAVAALAALASGLVAILAIPRSGPQKPRALTWGILLYLVFSWPLFQVNQ